MDFVIYGAQGMALSVYRAIHNLYPSRRIRCFLVSEYGINAKSLAGIPVLELEAFAEKLSQKEKDQIEVFIAVPESVMSDIERELENYGFHCYIRFTSLHWAELMSYFFYKENYFPLSALPIGYHKARMQMFLATFYKDKPLTETYKRPDWMIPIQAGTALCRERVADLLDNEGENISEKNGNYSELTALYWIWKNRLILNSSDTESEYYGLSHYRRILMLSEEDRLRLEDNEVDVVLPYPMIYEPNIEVHHKRYLKKADWEALLAALKEIHPQDKDRMLNILQQQYFYNYNILLARKKVLSDYCSWLFPILSRAEELSEPKGCSRKDRYIGYMGETLTTLYFMANRDRLNIVHTGYRFLI